MHQWTLNWTQIKILFPDAFTEKINEMQATLFKKNALFLSTNKNLKVQDSFLFLLVSIENSWSNSCLERSSFFPRHILHSAWPQSQGTLPFFAKQFGLTSQYSYWTFSILFLNRKVNVDDRRTSKAYLSKTKNDYCSKVKRGTWPLVIPIQLDVILSTRPSSLRKFVWPANSGKNSRTEVSQNWKQQHQSFAVAAAAAPTKLRVFSAASDASLVPSWCSSQCTYSFF